MTEPGRYEGPRRGVNLRTTNPTLFRGVLTVAIIFIAMALNFLLTVPTFEQFGIPKNVIGWGFMILGVGQVIALTLWRDLRVVRLGLAAGIIYCLFWGVGTSQTFFEGKSSLQLLILYLGIAAIQVPLLFSPYLNPSEGELEDDAD